MRIKFCGITRLIDAEHAAEMGAWAIGLNFWQGSVRRCEPGEATRISAAVRRRLQVAGVFVNASLGEVARAAEDHSLAIVQLHGDEGPSFCGEVARRTGAKVIKAIRVHCAADLNLAETFRTDYHLLDADHGSGAPGGTGQTFDWEILRQRRSEVPLILAGGLRPANVAAAIAAAHPFAVDVASGVESAPGIKDHALMEDFAARVRATEPVEEPA